MTLVRPEMPMAIINEINPWSLCQYPSWTWGYVLETGPVYLVCGGIMPITEGVVESWTLASLDLPFLKVRLPLIQEMAAFHLEFALQHDIRRIQSLVEGDSKHAHTMARRLGYKHEARLEEFGRQGEVRHRYAWLLKDHIGEPEPTTSDLD